MDGVRVMCTSDFQEGNKSMKIRGGKAEDLLSLCRKKILYLEIEIRICDNKRDGENMDNETDRVRDNKEV